MRPDDIAFIIGTPSLRFTPKMLLVEVIGSEPNTVVDLALRVLVVRFSPTVTLDVNVATFDEVYGQKTAIPTLL
jgi:hypothetical protein